MIKLKEILMEKGNITISDVEDILSHKYTSWDIRPLLTTIENFYYDEDPEKQQHAKDYLDLLNATAEHVKKLAKELGIPHFDEASIKNYLLHQQEFHTKMEEFFPFPLYISYGPEDYATIGILIDSNGKVLEVHEGNDEATPETIALANKLVNPSGKQIRIYGMHGTEVCRKIEESGYLPANLYVSPDRGHASRHWDNSDRSMFTGIVNLNDLSQESDIDWKTVGLTKIEKFRWL